MLIVLAGLTAIRADTWGAFDTFYQHAFRSHPDSPRVNTILGNYFADAGRYDEALQYLGKFNDIGFTLNRLYVRCQRDGHLDDRVVAQAAAGVYGVIDHHAVNSLVHLANAGLDGECTISDAAFSGLVEESLQQPISDRNRSVFLIYLAHYKHDAGRLATALATLRQASGFEQDTPIPLLLGTEWLLDAGEVERAQQWYAEALEIVAISHHDFTEYTREIEARLAKAGY